MTTVQGGRRRPPAITAAIDWELRIAVETRPLRASLTQAEYYTDLRGRRHPLAEMSAAEACLVLALLERHADTLHRGELAEYLLRPYPHPRTQALLDDAHRELASTSPGEWLRATPLHRALRKRASE
jgi:hypothetical protein